MNVVAVIEARMGSSRLPGKVMLPAAGQPMLAHLIARLELARSVDRIVLAIPAGPEDEPLRTFALGNKIPLFCGAERDVMTRVINAAKWMAADVIVEITADCPIIDPAIIDQAVGQFLVTGREFVTNAVIRSYPDGMDVNVFSLDTLKRSSAQTDDPYDREHVTTHIQRNPHLFSQFHLLAPPGQEWPQLGLTIDEFGDYELLRRIIEHFAPATDYTLPDVLDVLRDQHSDWLLFNSMVRRTVVR